MLMQFNERGSKNNAVIVIITVIKIKKEHRATTMLNYKSCIHKIQSLGNPNRTLTQCTETAETQ